MATKAMEPVGVGDWESAETVAVRVIDSPWWYGPGEMDSVVVVAMARSVEVEAGARGWRRGTSTETGGAT